MSQNFPWFVIFFCVCFRVNIIIPALQKKKKKDVPNRWGKNSGIYKPEGGERTLPNYLPASLMNYLVNMCLLIQYKLKIYMKATKIKFKQKALQ